MLNVTASAVGKDVGEEQDGFHEYAVTRRSALRRTAYLLCGDWYLADDLVQEALARLFVRWRRVRAKGEVEPYVRRMLINGWLATHRRAWRREVSTCDVPDRPAHADPDDGTRDALFRALNQLQPSQRAIIVLRYWEDLSVDQTAAALGCSTGNVKSQAARGLSHLRLALAGAERPKENCND